VHTQDTEPNSRKREEHLSGDGKWRSLPKVPNLIQYVSNGNYYGRIKIDGKIIRESLKTDVWTTAKLRLVDYQKQHQERRNHMDSLRFSEAVDLFKQELERDATMKPRSKEYRLGCLQKLQETWPELWDLRLEEISAEACKEWAAKLHKQISSQYYNNMIGSLRMIIAEGVKEHKQKCGVVLENPAMELKRVRVKPKDLKLPEGSHFKELIENLRMKSGGWGPRVSLCQKIGLLVFGLSVAHA
jgi:hypothetical protein